MPQDVLHCGPRDLRGMDSNSLLRLYDLAAGMATRAKLQQERARADKAVQSIARELRKRNVPL